MFLTLCEDHVIVNDFYVICVVCCCTMVFIKAQITLIEICGLSEFGAMPMPVISSFPILSKLV